MDHGVAYDKFSIVSVVYAATQPSLHNPHTLAFFIGALLGLACAVVPLWTRRDDSWQRRVYWTGIGIAILCAFLASLPDWKIGGGLALFVGGLAILGAYFNTPYIKIGKKIYAFYTQDSHADSPRDDTARSADKKPRYSPPSDSYSGLASAKKFWWLLVFVVVICVFNVVTVDPNKPWVSILAATMIVLIASYFGYGDASSGYSIARGQRPQFVLISAITAGVFALLYFAAYQAGKRWPLRRKQAMQYRAYPRSQEK